MVEAAGSQLAQGQHLAAAAIIQRLVKRILQVSALLIELIDRVTVFSLGFDQATWRLAAFKRVNNGAIKGEEPFQPGQQVGIETLGCDCVYHCG
ncbi:hypothetical protein D3C76_1729330 [compost metagenome]